MLKADFKELLQLFNDKHIQYRVVGGVGLTEEDFQKPQQAIQLGFPPSSIDLMTDQFIAKVSIEINAEKSIVWDALTKPELVKKYFFGTEVVSEWKVGKPIIFQGEWEGNKEESKKHSEQNWGMVLEGLKKLAEG